MGFSGCFVPWRVESQQGKRLFLINRQKKNVISLALGEIKTLNIVEFISGCFKFTARCS